MNKTLILGIAATALLSACTTMGERTFAFTHTASPADPQATGSARAVSMMNGMTETTLNLTGLTPGKTYAAHYHAFGPDSSTNPCASNGGVTAGFPNFTADGTGKATVTMTTETSKIAGDAGAYINVHYADNLATVPVCAPIKMNKG